MYQVKVLENNRFSKVQQIAGALAKDIHRGVLKKGEKLPSINEFSGANGVSRDTTEKAYGRLRASGYIISYPGRGYFVLGRNKKEIKVLLIINRLNSFKKIIYDALQESLGKNTKVDLCIHHDSARLLKEILETNLGRYDYYAIMPHFHSDSKPEEYLRILEMVPQHELIVLDKQVAVWGDSTKLVYQDFRHDIHEALSQSRSLLKKYNRISLVFPEKANQPKELMEGVADFCLQQGFPFKIIDNIENVVLTKHSVYIPVEEDDLAKLIKKVRRTGMVVGRDIGIISINESVFKELLDITVFTTDFEAMGRTVADLILGKEKGACRNPFYTIHRRSL